MIWFAPLQYAAAAASLLIASSPHESTYTKEAKQASSVAHNGRPQLVQDALLLHDQQHHGDNTTTTSHHQQPTLYYFGVGSNMLRSKIEGRGINGSVIEVKSMQPALIRNQRLAFNMRGFAPLEPGMGSLEPAVSSSSEENSDHHQEASNNNGALLSYKNPSDGCYECHGALIELTVDNYVEVMRSEGVGVDRAEIGSGLGGRRSANTGYEEIVVTAIPYDKDNRKQAPVQAIALRAKPGSRLRCDPCPSLRYMTILKQGAAELQLKPCYQEFLQRHPTQCNPLWLRKVAIYNMCGSFSLFGKFPWLSFLRTLQTSLLWAVYVPTIYTGIDDTASLLQSSRQFSSHVVSAVCLAPVAFVGILYKHIWVKLPRKQMSPMMMRFMSVLDSDEDKPTTSNR